MAFHSQRFLVLISRFKRTGYLFPYFPSSISLFSFSTLDVPSNSLNHELSSSVSHVSSNSLDHELSVNQVKNRSNLDEHYIFHELSDLLQIPRKNSISNLHKEPNAEKELTARVVDGFLLPEEKLRGVFLQKLAGKTAIENALTNVGVDLSPDVFAKVVNRGNLGGEAMVIFYTWALKQPNIPKDLHTYHIILKALGRRKYFDFMLKILHHIRTEGVRVNSDTLFIVMDSFVRARRVHKAIQMFGNLEEFGLKCDTESLNVLLQCLCKRSHVGAANSVLNVMKGQISFDSTVYNTIIGGWSKFGRVSEMERSLEAMVADGCNPNCSTFSYHLEGLGRAGQIDEAVEIFDNMKEKGCLPDTSVYNAMIANFISVGDFDECMRYYKRMLSGNCIPNMDTYTKLIAALLKARKVADALEMFDEMLGQGIIPSTGTITSFIERLCRFGPPHAALMIYKKARKVGCRISLSAYKLLFMRLSRFGKCGMLLKMWEEMQACGYPLDMEVYEYVINGLCNIGQLENAVLVMEESLREGFCPSRLIYSKLNNKLLASNKVEKAYKLYLKIRKARLSENARTFWRANGWHF